MSTCFQLLPIPFSSLCPENFSTISFDFADRRKPVFPCFFVLLSSSSSFSRKSPPVVPSTLGCLSLSLLFQSKQSLFHKSPLQRAQTLSSLPHTFSSHDNRSLFSSSLKRNDCSCRDGRWPWLGRTPRRGGRRKREAFCRRPKTN